MEVRTQERPSHGLEQFCSSLQDQQGLSVLDFAPASQSTVSFITNLGHRIYSDDILRRLDSVFGPQDFFAAQGDPQRVDAFLDQSLNFEEGSFDGALVWDTLQYLAPPVLEVAVDRLHRILRPGSFLLAFFHADEKANSIPVYTYRIANAKTIVLGARGDRHPAQFLNNRTLEKMFQKFYSVKFFLTRDHLREVIVKR